MVSFDEEFTEPSQLSGTPRNTSLFIAPYWADVDITTFGQIFYNSVNDSQRMQKVNSLVSFNFDVSFSATYIFHATWDRVAELGSSNQTVS